MGAKVYVKNTVWHMYCCLEKKYPDSPFSPDSFETERNRERQWQQHGQGMFVFACIHCPPSGSLL